MIKQETKDLLKEIAGLDGEPEGVAYNIRQDSTCAGKHSTDNIKLESNPHNSGLDIYVKPNTKKDVVYIPACITKSNVDDLVYNDFHVGENADVTIVAGCGVHVDSEEGSKHSGIHRFFIGKNAKVLYLEKHIATKKLDGKVTIDPETYVEIEEGGKLEMDTSQIGGVDFTSRKTVAKLGKDATLIIKENILTDGVQYAETDFTVDLNGENSAVDLISRAVAKDDSTQSYRSIIRGNAPCTGHSECDAIIVGNGKVHAAPELDANDADAMLIHEAAIGKIAGEQILKLQTLGLTEEEAEETIIQGFLK